MSENIKYRKKKEPASKKPISLRGILNIYGLLMFISLPLTIYTHPVTENVNGFWVFILVGFIVYFFLLNLYYFGGIWRKVVFISLCLIALFSISSAVFTITLH